MPKNLDLKLGNRPIYKFPPLQPQILQAYELETAIKKMTAMKYFFMLKISIINKSKSVKRRLTRLGKGDGKFLLQHLLLADAEIVQMNLQSNKGYIKAVVYSVRKKVN